MAGAFGPGGGEPPDNIIDHWFGPNQRPRQGPFIPGRPANEPSGPEAPLFTPWGAPPPEALPVNSRPITDFSDIGESKSVEPFDITGKFGPNDPIIAPLKPNYVPEFPPGAGTALGVAGVAYDIARQQYNSMQDNPPQSWESGVAGAEGSQQWNDPSTQGAEADVVQPADSAPAFTDWGGYQLPGPVDTFEPPGFPGMDSGGGAFGDSSGGGSYDASGGSDWYGGDNYGGGSGTGGGSQAGGSNRDLEF